MDFTLEKKNDIVSIQPNTNQAVMFYSDSWLSDKNRMSNSLSFIGRYIVENGFTHNLDSYNDYAEGGDVQFFKSITENDFNPYYLFQQYNNDDYVDDNVTLLNGTIDLKFKRQPNSETKPSTNLPYEVERIIAEDFEYVSYGEMGSKKSMSLREGSWGDFYIEFENLTLNELQEIVLPLSENVAERLEEKGIKGYGELGLNNYGQSIDIEVSEDNVKENDEYAEGGSLMERLDVDSFKSMSEKDQKKTLYGNEIQEELINRANIIDAIQSEVPIKEQLHLFINEEGYFGVDLDKVISTYSPSNTFTDGSPRYSVTQIFEMLNDIHYGVSTYADGGRVSKMYMNSKVPYTEYKSVFGDNDGDGIPNSDDVAPMDANTTEQIEEVRFSDELKEIIDYRNDFDRVREDMVEQLEEIVDVCGAKGRCGIMSRTKTPYSIINKMRRRSLTDVPNLDKLDKKAKEKLKSKDLSGIDLYKGLTDVVGTMVVTPDKRSSDKIKDEILSGRVGKVLEFEDMYEDSKAGYRAYHFLVGVEENGMTYPIEIQVKTQRIKALSDLAHTLYKQGKINPSAFEKLMDLANKGDKGSIKAQKEFDDIINDKVKVKRMITKNKFAEGGNVFSMYDVVDTSTQAQSNREVVEPFIPKHTYLNASEEAKLNLELLSEAVQTAPQFYQSRDTNDQFMNKAYLHYSNDMFHIFVTELTPDGSMYGYIIIGDDDEAYWGDIDRNLIDKDYNDDLINWKLDYNFHPQYVNEGLKRFGKRNLMSKDVKLTSAFGEDVDIDRIVNTNYPNDFERNRAIVNLMGFLGTDVNEYPIEAQNFISTYSCGLFKDVVTTRLYKTLAGMLYLNSENSDRDLERIMCINSCKGVLINFFATDINVTCVDTDNNAIQIANILYSRDNAISITRSDLQLNPPQERMDGMIIQTDSLDMAFTDLSYLQPNGVAVIMCYVDDFERFFATNSAQERFTNGFIMTEKYRISSDTMLIQVKKK